MTGRWRNMVLVILSCVTLLINTARGQSLTGNTILGKVRTQTGQAAANVIVELQTGNGQLITQVATTNEGDFAFTGLIGASFTLVINDPSHQPLSERLELTRTAETRPGETVRVELVLQPKTGTATRPPSTRTSFSQNIPKAAQEQLSRAMKLSGDKREEDAVAAMREALKIFPNYFDAHFALGNELAKINQLSEAIAELELARSINPKDDRVYQSFGLVLMKQNKHALAAAVFAEAFRLNPTDPHILLLRANSLLDYYSAIAQSTSKEAVAERERVLATAETELTKANDLSQGKLSGVHLQRARLYEKRGDRTRAAGELETYLKMEPDDKNAEALRNAIKTLRAHT